MDRLISLEPSKVVAVRVEPGEKCRGKLTLRNEMHTMPVAFRLQPLNRARYTVRPQTGIIPPLAALTLEIAYHLSPGSTLPEAFPSSGDSFLLHSVVAPGAAVKDAPSSLDSVPLDWFVAKKKQVFIDSGVRVTFVGSAVLARLVSDEDPSLEEVREVLECSDPVWRADDSVDPATGQTLRHLADSCKADPAQGADNAGTAAPDPPLLPPPPSTATGASHASLCSATAAAEPLLPRPAAGRRSPVASHASRLLLPPVTCSGRKKKTALSGLSGD